MKRLLIAPFLVMPALVLLSACGKAREPDALAAVAPADALCRPTPNGRDATGCYVTLTASRDDRLVSVSSPMAAQAEIHEMKLENGIMSMRELTTGLALPAGEAVALKPGGNHIMLLGLKSPLKTGETVSVTLNFEKAGPIGVRARVGQPGTTSGMASPGDMGPEAMHH